MSELVPVVHSVGDVKRWLEVFVAQHDADGKGCSCGWNPSEFGDQHDQWPTHEQHVKACLPGELADVLPSSTWVRDGDGTDRQVTFGAIYDENMDLIEERDRLGMELDAARSWCLDARRRVVDALGREDPVAGMAELRRWMAAVDAWERYRGE